MDDFSLTNSNRELSARGNSGDESGSSRVSRLSPSRSSFRGAARSGTLINYHRRLKLYCRRSLASHPEGRTVNVERTKIENFQVRRSFVRPFVRSFVRKFSRRNRDGIVLRGLLNLKDDNLRVLSLSPPACRF